MNHQIGESEHRRGLVLGLTLAEVLILMLFMMLLALGARMMKLERERNLIAEIALDLQFSCCILGLAGLPGIPGLPGVPGAPSWIGVEGVWSQPSYGGDVSSTTSAENPSRPKSYSQGQDVALSDAIEQTIVMARWLDPSDPPGVLKRMTELAASLPNEKSAMTELQQAIEEIRLRNPADPIGELKTGIKILKRMPRNVIPEDVAPPPGTSAIESESDSDSNGRHDWPPIIILSEADKYFFKSGSAELTQNFRDALSGKVIDALRKIIDEYGDVNVVEVVGHTDEKALIDRPSNLDKTFIPYLRGQSPSPELIPADNAGLGLARAVAVASVLLQDKRLSELRVLPLSGGQLIDVGDNLASGGGPKDIERRRRIEIRVRRSDRVASAPAEPMPKKVPTASPPAPPRSDDPPSTPRKRPSNSWNPFVFGN